MLGQRERPGLVTRTYTRSSAPPFSPSDIANLFLWMDADDAATISATAGSVDQWNDKSANGYNATASTTARPTTGTRTINGKNTLDFNGTTNTMVMPAGTYAIANGENTVFVAYQLDVTTQQRLIAGSEGGSSRWYLARRTVDNAYLSRTDTSFASTYNDVSGDTTSPHILTGRRTTVTTRIYYDGLVGADGIGANENGVDALYIGSIAGTGDFLNGRLAEIIVYSRSLTNAEMNQVGSYLSSKWAATWSAI